VPVSSRENDQWYQEKTKMKTEQSKCDSSVPATAPAAATEKDLGSETQMSRELPDEETGNDSRLETVAHIERVRELLHEARIKLSFRADIHDATKLCSPEKECFDEVTGALKSLTYGSPEYKAQLARLKPALDHHYACNSHHPEHYPNGINGMSLLDLIEMLCDWKAAGERHADGSMERSLSTNKSRFEVDHQLHNILCNTAVEMGWLTEAQRDALSSSRTTKSVASGEKENQPAPRPMEQQQRKESGQDYDRSIHSNPDAQAWAQFFCETAKDLIHKGRDPQELILDCPWMLSWFANAMMAMHDWLKSPERVALISSCATQSTDAGGTKPTFPAPVTATEEKKWDGCPCKHTTPCRHDCTCVNPMMSCGCSRCATYGSAEQKRQMAEHLAAIIDAAHSTSPQPSVTDEHIAREKAVEVYRSLFPNHPTDDVRICDRLETFILSAIQETKRT
jgi:hypothetical protein